MSNKERDELEHKYKKIISEDYSYRNIVGYSGNKTIPFLRIFRYREAFSYQLVKSLLSKNISKDDYIFDPFCGMGTTTYTASDMGIPSTGIDQFILPSFIASTLPLMRNIDFGTLTRTYNILLKDIKNIKKRPYHGRVTYVNRGYTNESIMRILQWRDAIDSIDDNIIRDSMRLLLIASIEEMGRTVKDGAYPRIIDDKDVVTVDNAIHNRIKITEDDIKNTIPLNIIPDIIHHSVFDIDKLNLKNSPSIVMTSPPYLNRYDYTSIYSVETSLGFGLTNDDIKNIRNQMIRSHISGKKDDILISEYEVINEIIYGLNNKRDELNNKRIPHMIYGYFADMECAIDGMCNIVREDGKIIIVVSNSRFNGEIIPVDLIFCEIAKKYGFLAESIIVARYKGNSPQQMTKYGRVPVRESILTLSKR